MLKTDKVEISLLRWYSDFFSKIHDHSHNSCYMKNNKSFINKSYYHKIENNTIYQVFSLHIYSLQEHKVKFYTGVV